MQPTGHRQATGLAIDRAINLIGLFLGVTYGES
jgi:hypothetical protein